MLLVILSFTQVFQVANAAKDEWNQLADLPTARIGAVANAVDGKIYVIGGFNALNETLEYDPSADKWTKRKDMPSGRGGAASVVVGSKIYVLAGNHQNSFNKFEVYDTKKDEWEVLTDIPFESPSKGAYNVQAGVMGDKIYVLGGNEFFSYDLTENKWKKEASPSFKTQRAIGLVLKGKFYIIGENNNSEIFEFDASNDSWSAKKGGFKKVYLSGVTYKDNMILPGISPNRLYVYNAEKEEMVKVVVPNNDIRVGASSVIIGDMLYVIGGRQYNINLNYTDIADRNYKSVISISLKDLEFPNNTETPGDKDPEPTTPPKDDATDEDGNALLIITMVNGLQKEYDLSMKEVNAFLSWYKKRDAGEGPGFYEIDEHDNNKGPFESKKDYVVFKNILMFEVNKYKK